MQQLKQCVLSCTSPLSSKSSEKQSESDESRMKTTEQCTQTEVDATISLDDRMITQSMSGVADLLRCIHAFASLILFY